MRLDRAMATGVAALLTLGLLFAPATGRAEGGLLEFLFGPDPTPAQPQYEPQRSRRDSAPARRVKGDLRFAKPKDGLPAGGTGFASAPTAGGFCVRTCDGYYFPLIKSARATRQQSCEFACPSAPVEIYDGATIETARNYKGQRYSALPVAFAFRDRANSNCACNDPRSSQVFFEKTARHDPTLQSGDVVVEDSGAFVFSGEKLVPLSNASFMSSTLRDRLRAMLRRAAGVNSMTNAKPAAAEAPSAVPAAEADTSKDDRTGSTARQPARD